MPRNDSPPILVTGAGSGIGWHLTETLSSRGVRVFATARRAGDLEHLAQLPLVTPVEVDLRDSAAIWQALRRIEDGTEGLGGLVNNAGIGGIGPFVSYTEDELTELFAVNVHAPILLINAALPMLLRCRGRVVNIGSQGGSISSKYFGPYTMTKHALEALTTSLAEELAPHGVSVSIVQPGGIESRIGETSLPSSVERFRRAPAPFDEEARAWARALQGDESGSEKTEDSTASTTSNKAAEAGGAAESGIPSDPPDRRPSSPSIVTKAVLHALYAERPRLRYLVGTQWEGDRVVHSLLERLVDANACPSLGYSRDELVARLDALLAERIRDGTDPTDRDAC